MKSICLFLLFLCSQAFGQTDNAHKTVLGLNVSPAISYRHLGNSETTEARNGLEDNIMGYLFGMKLGYEFNKSLGIESGLHYIHRGYRTKEMRVMNGDGADHMKIGYHFNYMGLPLKLVCRKESEKGIFTVKAGIITNFLLKKEAVVYLYYDDNKKKIPGELSEDYSGLSMTSVFSIGLGDKIGRNLYVEVEPYLMYDISSITTGSLKTHLWDLGLGLNLYWKLAGSK
jgi:hypothetical protein